MIDTYCRAPYQRVLVDPFVSWLSRGQVVTPMHLTFFGLFLGVLVIPLLAYDFVWAAFCLILLSGYLDTVDGSLARQTQRSCPKGAVLDIVCDRLVEFSIILGLYFVDPASRALLCLLMLGSVLFCITSFLVVGIFSSNESEKSFYYSPGIMERTEAFLFFVAMILLPSFFLPLALLFTVLVALTAVIRIYQFN